MDVTSKKRALQLAYQIVTDKRNTNRYSFTAIMRVDDPGDMFTYADMLNGLRALFNDLDDARKTPALQKPLTWEEISDHKLIFMELRGIDKPIPSILRQTIDDQAFYTMESGCVFTFAMDELGKRWRPWASEPTEEERAAAPWEGVGDADL